MTDRHHTTLQGNPMNLALWILAGLLAVPC
jgi:hypothetical protein